MADTKIDITGVQPGQVKAAGWATEKTLEQLALSGGVSTELLAKIAKVQNLTDADIRRLLTVSSKGLGTIASGVGNLTSTVGSGQQRNQGLMQKIVESSFKVGKDTLNGLNNLSRTLSHENPASIFGIVGSSLTSFSNLISQTNPLLGTLLKGIGVVVIGFEGLVKTLVEQNQTFRNLYTSGVRLETSQIEFARNASSVGLTIREFAEILGKYGSVTATLGTQRVMGLSRQFASATRGGAEFNMTMRESQEALMETIDMMNRGGGLRGLSDMQIAKRSQGYLQTLTDLSSETGISVARLREQNQAYSKTTNSILGMAALPENMRENMEKILAGTSVFGDASDKMKDAMLGYATRGVQGLSAAMLKMFQGAGVGPVVGQAAREYFEAGKANDVKRTEEAKKRLAEALQGLTTEQINQIQLMDSALADLVAQSRAGSVATANMAKLQRTDPNEYTKRKKQQDEAAETLRKQTEAIEKAKKYLVDFQRVLAEIVMRLSPVLLPALETLAFAAGNAAKMLGDIVQWVSDTMKTKFGMGAGGAGIAGVVAGAVVAVMAVMLSAKGIGLIARLMGRLPGQAVASMLGRVPGISSLLGGGAAAGAGRAAGAGVGGLRGMVGGIAGTLGDVFKVVSGIIKDGAAAIGSAIASLSKGIGSGIASLGKGVGTAVKDIVGGLGKGVGMTLEAILRGLALGLGAFGNPKILLGAGIFAGAIVLIGASLAGAGWIMGKAMPTLAEGLKSFSGIDGDQLWNVGKGISAVAGGLALLAAGTIVSGIGGLANALLSLFGIDPVSQLKKFADIGPPLGIAADALDKLALSLPKVTTHLDGFAAIGKLFSSGLLDGIFGSKIDQEKIDSFIRLFDILGSSKDILDKGSVALKLIGDIYISEDQIKNLQSLSGLFSSSWIGSLFTSTIDPVMVRKFSEMIKTFAKEQDTFIKGKDALQSFFSLTIDKSKIGALSDLADAFSNKFWSKDFSDVNLGNVNVLVTLFDAFGKNIEIFRQGKDAINVLADLNFDAKKFNQFQQLASSLSTRMRVIDTDTGVFAMLKKFAEQREMIDNAVAAINRLAQIDVSSLARSGASAISPQPAQPTIVPQPQALAPGTVPTVSADLLGRSTMEFYQKQNIQMQRMIELLELVNDKSDKTLDANTRGFNDMVSAVGRIGRVQ